MTPIKFIGWSGALVFAVDHAGRVEIVATAANEERAQWIAWSLGLAHHVSYKRVDGLPVMRYADAE